MITNISKILGFSLYNWTIGFEWTNWSAVKTDWYGWAHNTKPASCKKTGACGLTICLLCFRFGFLVHYENNVPV